MNEAQVIEILKSEYAIKALTNAFRDAPQYLVRDWFETIAPITDNQIRHIITEEKNEEDRKNKELMESDDSKVAEGVQELFDYCRERKEWNDEVMKKDGWEDSTKSKKMSDDKALIEVYYLLKNTFDVEDKKAGGE